MTAHTPVPNSRVMQHHPTIGLGVEGKSLLPDSHGQQSPFIKQNYNTQGQKEKRVLHMGDENGKDTPNIYMTNGLPIRQQFSQMHVHTGGPIQSIKPD